MRRARWGRESDAALYPIRKAAVSGCGDSHVEHLQQEPHALMSI